MSFASTGRRRYLQLALASAATALVLPSAHAEPAALKPIRELCDSLIGIMRAGKGTPFAQRFESLAPTIERAFDLQAILQLSVGTAWAGLPPEQQSTLLAAFRSPIGQPLDAVG